MWFKKLYLKQALLIFVRNPVSGKVKTRLAKTVGDEKALSIYKELLCHTYTITQALGYNKFVFYADEIWSDDIWNNDSYYKGLQWGNNIGERMKHAFAGLFDAGYNEVCIVGSDCYELTTVIIQHAFTTLQQYDVVIGPAADGGYYLLAMKKPFTFLFDYMDWSTDKVLQQTVDACTAGKLSYHLLQALHDIDDEQDWLRYTQQQDQ